jgi:hypothetical protein
METGETWQRMWGACRRRTSEILAKTRDWSCRKRRLALYENRGLRFMIVETGIVKKLLVVAVFAAIMVGLGYLATTVPGIADGATRLTGGLSAGERPKTSSEPQTYRCRIGKEFELERGGTQVRTTHQVTACGNEDTKR